MSSRNDIVFGIMFVIALVINFIVFKGILPYLLSATSDVLVWLGFFVGFIAILANAVVVYFASKYWR